jgi:uncharacterized delta-60 repeat protein
VWTQRYNNPDFISEYVCGCAVDRLNNIYVVGSCFSFDSFYDYLIIKYNAAGDTLWTRLYNGPGNGYDEAFGCSVDSLGNLYVTGRSESATYSDYGYLTVKYNTSGDTLWTRRYNSNTNSHDGAFDCTVDGLGNLYVTGFSIGTMWDCLTIKYNSDGDTLWTRRYNGPANNQDGAYGCAVDSLNNIYVVGFSNNGTTDDYLIIKYNPDGDALWTRRYDGPDSDYDYAESCAVDGLGNLYVTGESSNGVNWDCLTIKYNTDGDTLWTLRYNTPDNGDEAALDCAVDGQGNLYLTGAIYTDLTMYTPIDYLTIKYNTATGVTGKPELPTTVSKLRLEQNRPNPFSQHTTISYQLPSSGTASLKIYNAAGQLVKTFNMSQQQAGYHQVEWSGSNIPAGVYFYRLTAGNYQATKKLVVVR